MLTSWSGALIVAALLAKSAAQSVTPMNWTGAALSQQTADSVDLTVSLDTHDMGVVASVISLTPSGIQDIPTTGLSGPVFLANAQNVLTLQRNEITFISCDAAAYPGMISALNIMNTAIERNSTGIIFYSTQSDWCYLQSAGDGFPAIFTMETRNDTQQVLNQINAVIGGDMYVKIGPSRSLNAGSNGTSTTASTATSSSSTATPTSLLPTNSSLGPPPSTAIAMIILYSITGIITALFLVIIVTGAVRAHRHPERYGPRNMMGRARQSRARGLARAMLDSLPIVKFGERAEAKPGDLEMDGTAATATGGQARAVGNGQDTVPASSEEPSSEARAAAQPRESADGGIAAATVLTRSVSPNADRDAQGCSICTEDFEIGQDQRVLPCNHRFHPACVDPWLLNISGTCPLCRIDLRPPAAQITDADGNVIARDGDEVDGLAPPLEEATPTMSVRRSILLGLMGIVPERMTREERIRTLQMYHDQQAQLAARRRMRTASVAASEQTPSGETALPLQQREEQERSTRQRLRNAFPVRTRRTGQPAAADDDVSGVPPNSDPRSET